MSRNCEECGVKEKLAHLPTCSFAPPRDEREEFIRENAVEVVRGLEAKVLRRSKELAKQHKAIRSLRCVLEAAHKPLKDLLDQAMPTDLKGAVEYLIDHSNEGWKRYGLSMKISAEVADSLGRCMHENKNLKALLYEAWAYATGNEDPLGITDEDAQREGETFAAIHARVREALK